MVEYKKKKLILQSGGTRNYYYKVSSDGKKKQVSKSEYLEKKGGKNKENNEEKNEEKNELRLSLMEIFIRLNENKNNENANYKKILSNKIVELEFTSLYGILKLISTILEKYTLENPIVKLILKKLAEFVKRDWTPLDIKIVELSNEKLIKCLVRLLDFVATKKVTTGDIRDIIQKIIRKILIQIINRNIIIPDSIGNRDISLYKKFFNDEKNQYTKNFQKSNNVQDETDSFAQGLMFLVWRSV